MQNARILAGVFLSMLGLGGCAIVVPQTAALHDAWPQSLPGRAELSDVPFFPQQEYQCGPAALATVMAYAGAKVTPDELVPQVYLPERKGTLQVEMLAAPRRQGLVTYALAPRLEDLLREVSAGTPVVVLLGYGMWPFQLWHYAVVVGYDRLNEVVLLRSGLRQRQEMPIAVLEYTWKDSGRWSMVASRAETLPATAQESSYLEAVHAMARVGDPRAAARAYGAFLARWPASLPAMIGMANALHASGDLASAESTLRRALEHHADSVVVLNNLAQTLSDQGRDREALEVAQRAVASGGPFASSAEETRQSILKRLEGR